MKEKKGIVSLTAAAAAWIIGIASIVAVMSRNADPANVPVGDINLFMTGGVYIPLVFGLAAIISGIWSIVKKQDYRIMAFAGILLALPVVLWGFTVVSGCIIVGPPAEVVKVFLEGALGA